MDGIRRDPQAFLQIPDRDKKVLEIEKRKDERDEECEGQEKEEEKEEEHQQEEAPPPPPREEETQASGQVEPYVSRGKTGLGDTWERKAVSQMYAMHAHHEVFIDQIIQELNARGCDCYETLVEEKSGIRFENGNVYIDTGGNHVLDLADRD